MDLSGTAGRKLLMREDSDVTGSFFEDLWTDPCLGGESGHDCHPGDSSPTFIFRLRFVCSFGGFIN